LASPVFSFQHQEHEMPYTVTITESRPGDGIDTPNEREVFRQTVDALDLRTVFAAVNKKPRKARERKAAPKVAQ
jgi:hypothetical protein